MPCGNAPDIGAMVAAIAETPLLTKDRAKPRGLGRYRETKEGQPIACKKKSHHLLWPETRQMEPNAKAT